MKKFQKSLRNVIRITVKVTEVTVETENSICVFERMWKNGELL